MDTKIALSDKELEMVCNTDWILTKHAIIQKVYKLFGEMLPLFEKTVNENKKYLPAEVFINSPKISKGENYKLLPYVMLDYPRYFGKDETVAIRTFFWWGNFFSVSLQLSGSCKTNALEVLHQNFEWLQQNEYCICINDNPWEHHFDTNNFAHINTIDKNKFTEILLRNRVVKIAKNIPLNKWQDAPEFILKVFSELAGLLKNGQAPKR